MISHTAVSFVREVRGGPRQHLVATMISKETDKEGPEKPDKMIYRIRLSSTHEETR